MATIDTSTAVVSTRQTTMNRSYTDISGAAIADTEFMAGEKYLILVTGMLDLASNAQNVAARVLHGSTAFDDSVLSIEPASTNQRTIYPWFEVWTAVAGEGIKVQFKNDDGVTTAGADNMVLSAIRISQLVQNTDWFVATNTTPTALTSTFQDGATVTFTPGTAGDYLVLTLSQVSGPSGTQAIQSRQNRSGEASSTDPTTQIEGEDPTNDVQQHLIGCVYSLGTSSNTFKEQVRTLSGTTGSRISSKVLVLRLAAFRSAASAYTAAQLDSTAGGAFSDQVQTVAMAPAVGGDVLCFGSFLWVCNGLGISVNGRLQVDNTDVPPTQTGDGYPLETSADAADVVPIWFHTISTLDTSSHTLDVDGSTATATAGRGYKNRLAVMLLLETTATAATTTGGGSYFFRRSRS